MTAPTSESNVATERHSVQRLTWIHASPIKDLALSLTRPAALATFAGDEPGGVEPFTVPWVSAVYDRIGPGAYASAVAILQDPDAAAAVVEDAFREVVRAGSPPVSVEAGAIAIAIATHRLANASISARSTPAPDETPIPMTPDVLERLTSGERAALELAVFEGLKVGAIAERMQLSAPVVLRLLNDGLGSLRRHEAPSVLTVLERWRATLRRWEGLADGRNARFATGLEVAHAWLGYQMSRGGVAPDDVVLISDDDRRYVAASANAAPTLGRRSLVGRHVDDLTPEEGRESLPEMWDTFLTTGSMQGEYDCVRPGLATIRLRFRAYADRPLPGLHVSYLRPVPFPDEATEDHGQPQAGRSVAVGFPARMNTA